MARAYTDTPNQGNKRYVLSDDSVYTPGEAIRTTLLNRISWAAVLAGVAMAFVAQLVLNLLGIGIGLVSLDTPQQISAEGLSWAGAVWWTVAGVIAAFCGGFTAGRLSGEPKESTAGWHGLISWAAGVLVVATLMTTAAGAAVNMGSPFQIVADQSSGMVTITSESAAASTAATPEFGPPAAADAAAGAETATIDPDVLAMAALMTAIALLIGAVSAWYGGVAGMVGRNEAIVEKRERESVTFQ